MYARTLILLCLLLSSVRASPASRNLFLYLGASRDIQPAALSEMRSELESLMRSMGFNVAWWDSGKTRQVLGAYLVVVDLRGACHLASERFEPLKIPTSVASSTMADGTVQPFISVGCETLNRYIGNAILRLPPALREYLYGRALARLLAHELYHVLANTAGHAASGIAKASITSEDLLSEHLELGGEVDIGFQTAGDRHDLVYPAAGAK